jgi:predicted GIY-YIG superfamily endonuclease
VTPLNDSRQQKKHPNIEHSEAWQKGDKDVTRFFVYILKLDGGKFYVGQTRELRERLSEHRDDETGSTKGLNPRLQYFEVLSTREAAEFRESELKNIAQSNPRQIRRMIIGFKDLISELNYE